MQPDVSFGKFKIWRFLLAFFFIIGLLQTTATTHGKDTARPKIKTNGVFLINYIPAERVKKELEALKIGEVITQIDDKLLITVNDSEDLIKAESIISMIDSETVEYSIQTIALIAGQNVPTTESVEKTIKGVSVGDLHNKPADSTAIQALIDVHNSALLVIAPKDNIDKLAAVVKGMMSGEKPVAKTSPKPEPKKEEVTPAAQEAKPVEKKNTKEPVDEKIEPAKTANEDPLDIGIFEALAEAERLQEKLVAAKTTATEPKQEAIAEEQTPVIDLPMPVEPKAEVEVVEEAVPEEIVVEAVAEEIAVESVEIVPPAVSPDDLSMVLAEIAKLRQELAEAKTAQNVPDQKGETKEYIDSVAIGDVDKEIETVINMPNSVPLVDLIDMVGQQLGLNYMYNPSEITGDVTLKLHEGKIKQKEMYALLESVLRFNGFAMTRRGELVTIVKSSSIGATVDAKFYKPGDKIDPGDVMVMTVFKLENITADSAKVVLNGMKLGTLSTETIAETNTIIITEYAHRMARVEEVLKMIDVAGKKRTLRFRKPKYTMAEILLPKVSALADELGTIKITLTSTSSGSAGTATPSTSSRTTSGGATPDQRAADAKRRAAEAAAKRSGSSSSSSGTGTLDKGVYLDYDERTNRILMIGEKDDLDLVESLIDTLDVEQEDLRIMKEYEIQFVDPSEIIDTLGELGIVTSGKNSTTSSSTARRTTGSSASRSTTPSSAANAAVTPTDEPQIAILEATNSLLIKATPEQHTKIVMVIAHVDRELTQATTPYVVYPLENQDPEELAGVLQDLVSKTITQKARSTDTAGSKVVVTAKPTAKDDADITIIPDAATYSLIVHANKKNQQMISNLIKELDEYRPQVLIDVTLVEITQNEGFEFDFDVVAKTYGGSGMQDGTPVGAIGNPFSMRSLADAMSKTTDAGKTFTGYYNSEMVQVFLTAVQNQGYGRIMAKPKILVNDNQEGEITTKNTTAIAQLKSDTQIPTSGNPVTTTDVTFNDYDEGVTLNIKPHISKGDMLRLEIILNRTDFTEKPDVVINGTDTNGEPTSASFPSPPDRLSTDVVTVATVPDGTTIILGGLEDLGQTKTHSKIPILGDLPLIGGLFRTVENAGDQGRLYVFVKAHIIRPGDQVEGLEDIRRVSSKNREEFEKMERKFQKVQDWPGVDPVPMSPLKILEDDDEINVLDDEDGILNLLEE